MVPDFFGSFMFKCFMEPGWFPFWTFSPLVEINHFWNKSRPTFLDGFQCFWLLYVNMFFEPSWFPFLNFKPAWWNNWNKIAFLDGFRCFGYFMLTCYMEPIAGSHFWIFSPLVERNYFWNDIEHWFHVDNHAAFTRDVSISTRKVKVKVSAILSPWKRVNT